MENDAIGTPTTDRSMFILTSCRLHSSYHNKIYTVRLKYQTLKVSMISYLCVTLFMIYK